MKSIDGNNSSSDVAAPASPPAGKVHRSILAQLKAAVCGKPRLNARHQPSPVPRGAGGPPPLSLLQPSSQPAAPILNLGQLPTPNQLTDAIAPPKEDKRYLHGLIVHKRSQTYKQILNLLGQWHQKIGILREDIPQRPQDRQELLAILANLDACCSRYRKHAGRPGTEIFDAVRDQARQLGDGLKSADARISVAPAEEIAASAHQAAASSSGADAPAGQAAPGQMSRQQVCQNGTALRFENVEQLRDLALDKVRSDPQTVWFVESLEQLSALVSRAALSDGRLYREDGPLAAALVPDSGFCGTLLLNYETIGKQPGGLSAINDLLGNPPKLGERVIQSGLGMVPMLTTSSIRPQMADVISRLGPMVNGNDLDRGGRPATLQPIADAAQLEKIKAQGALVVDFHHSHNWRETLFGRLVMDAGGRRLVPSHLAEHLQAACQAAPKGPAKPIVLKNMPADPELHRMVDQLLCGQPVHFLGMELQAPMGGLFGHRTPVYRFDGYTEPELNTLADTAAVAAMLQDATAEPVQWIINAQNFHTLYNDLTIPPDDSGELIVHGLADRFRQDRGEHVLLRVNSNLSAGQWVELLKLIRQVNHSTSNRIALQIEADVHLPQKFDFLKDCQNVPNGFDSLPHMTASVQSLAEPLANPDLLPWILRNQGTRKLFCVDEALASETIRNLCRQDRQKVLFADISAGTRPESWWQHIEISSFNQFKLKDTADRSQIDFLTALQAGTPIVIRGLADDPSVWASLSTLQCRPSYLVINGERREFANANLIVLDAAQIEAETQVEKQSYRDYFVHHPEFEGVLQNRQPDFQKALDFLETLSQQTGRPFLRAAPIGSLLRQVRSEISAAEPQPFKKAIDSLLLKQFRDNPERYAQFKCLNRRLWQDENNRQGPFFVHAEPITRLMAPVKTEADLDGRLWQLAAQMDPALLAHPLSTRDKNELRAAVAAVVIGAEADDAKKDYYRRIFKTPDEPGRTDLYAVPPATESERAQRKQIRLWDKIQQHPITWILGEAATGKSWLSGEVVEKNHGRIVRINAGPLTGEGDLVGRAAVKPTPDGRDTCTEYMEGKLLEWIHLPTIDQKPAVLIVDEFNLAQPGVWNALKGLAAPDGARQIFLNGKAYPVSDQHRVVFTGNPPHYTGRNQDQFFMDYAVALYFKPLAPQTIQEQVIGPALDRIIEPEKPDLKRFAAGLLLDFYSLFPSLGTGHGISVRDLHDILKHLHAEAKFPKSPEYLGYADDHPAAAFTAAMRRAIHLSLGYLLSDSARAVLDDWLYLKTPGVDGRLGTGTEFFDSQPTPPNDFGAFYTDLQNHNPDLFLESERLRGYVKEIQTYVGYRNAEAAGARDGEADPAAVPMPARRGLLVQAIQGTGKDHVLDTCLDRLCPNDYAHITCNPHTRLSELIQAIGQAREQGKILVISEMNLVPSSFMESINDALTGACAPGFMLIATVNPDHFAGRHPISPALKSRLTQVRLPDPDAAEYQAYTQFMLRQGGADPGLARALVDQHMQAQQQAGFCLGFRDLARICDYVRQQPQALDSAALNQKVRDIYAKYAAGSSQAGAPTASSATPPQQPGLFSHEILGGPGLVPQTGSNLSESLPDALLVRLRSANGYRSVPKPVLQTVCTLLLQQKLPGIVPAQPAGTPSGTQSFLDQLWNFFQQGLAAAGTAAPQAAIEPVALPVSPADKERAWLLGSELRTLLGTTHLPLSGCDEHRLQQSLGRAAETIKGMVLRQVQEQATGPSPVTQTGAVPHALKMGFLAALKAVMPQLSSGSPSSQIANRLLQMADEKDDYVPDKNLGHCSLRKGFLLEKLFSAAGEPIDLARLLPETDPPDAPDPDSAIHDFTTGLELDPENRVRVYLPAEAMCGQISQVRIREKSSPDGPAVLDLANNVFQPQYRNGRWAIDLGPHQADLSDNKLTGKKLEVAYSVTENRERMRQALQQIELIYPNSSGPNSSGPNSSGPNSSGPNSSARPAEKLAPGQAVLSSALRPAEKLDLSQMAGLPPFKAARQITSFLRDNYIYSLNPKVKNSWLPVFAKPLTLPQRIAFLNAHQKGQCAVFANVLCEIMKTLHPTVHWIPAAGREIKNGHFNTSGHAVLLGLDQSGEWRIFDATPGTLDKDRLTQRQASHWDSLSASPNPLLNVRPSINLVSYEDGLRYDIYNAHKPQTAAKIRSHGHYNKRELAVRILQELKIEPRWQAFQAAAETIFDKDFSMCATRKTFAVEVLQSILDLYAEDIREKGFSIYYLEDFLKLAPLFEDGILSMTPKMKDQFQQLCIQQAAPLGAEINQLNLNPAGLESFFKLVREKVDSPATTSMVPSHLPGEIDPARLGTETPFVSHRLQKGTSKKPVNIISFPRTAASDEFLTQLFHALGKDVRVAGYSCNSLNDFLGAMFYRRFLGDSARFFLPPVQQDPEKQTLWGHHDMDELQQAFKPLYDEAKIKRRTQN